MFSKSSVVNILERTPAVLTAMVQGLDKSLLHANEGPETWSPFDVVGHLIHGERTDWIPRMKIILEHGISRPFDPFDRTAQFHDNKGKDVSELLATFADLRMVNVRTLKDMQLSQSDLQREGVHPALGRVTLRQLLATWAVHDMDHLQQVARVIAKQYDTEVGPWKEYLRILRG